MYLEVSLVVEVDVFEIVLLVVLPGQGRIALEAGKPGSAGTQEPPGSQAHRAN